MVTEFIRPFVIYLACMNDLRQIKHVVKNIFRYLIFQSDVGMDYTEKFNVWRQVRNFRYLYFDSYSQNILNLTFYRLVFPVKALMSYKKLKFRIMRMRMMMLMKQIMTMRQK